MKKAIVFLLIFMICGAVGCTEKTADINDAKPVIAVTIAPQKAFVSAVCGELVEVITVVPPGYSPENYEPTPSQQKALSKAMLYFSIGVNAEQAILPALEGIKVVSLHNKVAEVLPDITFEDGGRDPHIWLSLKRTAIMTEVIQHEISLIDGANKGIYQKNAEQFIEELRAMDKKLTDTLSGVKNKSFISYHPAFGYFADDYSLKMYTLEKDGKEATMKHLQQMVDFAKQQNIKVIFYQKEIDSSQSKAFAREIGGKTIQLEPLSENYIENMSKMSEIMAEVMQ
ncbi:MAG: zinc ABC transporter substrate-binding protein [Firmicutes bacterium]|nr:zinc ABC transporter substrate-binding protein [Bacillota bacterium]